MPWVQCFRGNVEVDKLYLTYSKSIDSLVIRGKKALDLLECDSGIIITERGEIWLEKKGNRWFKELWIR